MKLFMVLIGCRPAGRHTEQHDVFFGIADALRDLIPEILAFWPEAKGHLHIDGWREVTLVDNYRITVTERSEIPKDIQLYFINLGGYKPGEMEEFHYKLLATGKEKNEAIKKAKATAFFRHTTFDGATSHVDDKYGVDLDDLALIEEILPPATKARYSIQLTPAPAGAQADELHLGYFKLSVILKGE